MRLVSAIITTYKRPIEILSRAVDSILAQTYENIEIIIVDDNREDAQGQKYSEAIADFIAKLKTASRFPIALYKTEDGKHGGQPARNTGIHNASGEYLAFLDDDDEWLPEKIKKQVTHLQNHPEAGMCFCNGNRINENFAPPFINNFNRGGVKAVVTYAELLRGDCIGTTTQAMIRRSVFSQVGEFDEAFPARQDYEMWIRIASKYTIVGIDEILFNYYISKSNTNNQVAQNMDKCIEGHRLLYQKYKNDIDKDIAAKYNVKFNLAHYLYFKGEKINGIIHYIIAFFTYPKGFFESGKEKIRQMREKKKNG